MLALVGGRLSGLSPHTDYLLEFLPCRPGFTNSVSPEVEIFGPGHVISRHFSPGRLRPLYLQLHPGPAEGESRLLPELLGC